MPYKNLDLRRQRGRERYARNREARKQAAREYYARNADTLREKNRIRAYESREKYKDKIQLIPVQYVGQMIKALHLKNPSQETFGSVE